MKRRGGRSGWVVGMALGAVSVCLAPAAPAQSVAAQGTAELRGIVLDARTDEPLEGSVVLLEELRVSVVTGTGGAFELGGVPSGTLTLRAESPGYSTVVQTIEVVPGETQYVRLGLDRFAALLEELVVRTSRAPETVEVRGPGARGDRAGTAADLLTQRVPGIQLRRNVGSAGGGARVQLRGPSSLFLSNGPAIYLDGILLSPPSTSVATRGSAELHALEQIPASSVARIRVLRGPAAATRYPNGANGVILIETRTGSATSAPPDRRR